MRIAFIIGSLAGGGAERVVERVTITTRKKEQESNEI